MKVLIVEDEINIIELLKFNLELRNYNVEYVEDGLEAFDLTQKTQYDFIFLDVMIPSMNGLKVLESIRDGSINQHTPIMMLTAKSSEEDIILGLELGADGYLAKPFSVNELIARFESILKRNLRIRGLDDDTSKKASYINLGHAKLNRLNRSLIVDSVNVPISKKEFDLLVYLYENKNKALSRQQILSKVWSNRSEAEERTVDVHIKKLRKKIEPNDKKPSYIKTVFGIGYMLNIE